MNRRASAFMLILVAVTLAALGLLTYVLITKADKFERNVGERALAVLSADSSMQKKLYYIDQAAAYAVRQAQIDLAHDGGVPKRPCGDAGGYALWNDYGRLCTPDRPEEELFAIFNRELNIHLAGFGGYYAAGTVSKSEKESVPVLKPADKSLEYINSAWGHIIRKYCRMPIPGLDTFASEEECVCTAIGIINQESGGNSQAQSNHGALGLMQVMPDTAKFVTSTYGLGITDPDLYDPDTNVMLGMHYLHYLKKTGIPGAFSKYSVSLDYREEYLYAAYNGGTCGQNSGGTTGALCPSRDCPGSLAYICPVNRGGYEETFRYAARVAEYKQACIDAGMAGAEESLFDRLPDSPEKSLLSMLPQEKGELHEVLPLDNYDYLLMDQTVYATARNPLEADILE